MILAPAPPPPPPPLYYSTRHHSQRKTVNFLRSPYLHLPKTSVHASARDVDAFTESSGYLFELSTSEAESLTEYDISKIASIYLKKPLIVFRRLLQIGNTLGKWLVLRYFDSVSDQSDLMFEVRASQLREILAKLGPAYIKIAQAVSSRPDLIPPSYLNELSLLQDRISPFSTEIAFNTIEKELGLPLNQLFSEITPEPVAAASLGQVYQARLQDTGQIVAVKVQRPGVQAAISLDILILRALAGLIRRAGKFNTDLQAVVDEWASSLFREMDYVNEAKNGVRFRELYGDLKDVMVPDFYISKTTRKVITMQWIEGQKLSEVKDLYLVEIGVYCSFNQLLEYGFYHADPHPGNLLRTYDGKLAYLDFGMMGEFKQELRDGFIEACIHLINRDYDSLAKDFVTLGLLPATADKDAVTKALTGVFQNAVSKGVRNISFGDLLGNLGTTMYKFKFQIPSYFSLVIRSLAVLEGIAINNDPNYKVLGGTYPWIARKVLTDSSPQLRSSLQSLLYEDGVFRIDRLESLLSESLRARTERALVKTEDDGSNEAIKQIMSFTLTEKGAFVREILLQEFAKGLDALGVATLDSWTSAATANLPFAPSPPSSLTDEDMINLRNLHRLLQLLSGSPNIEDADNGVEAFNQYTKKRTSSEEVSLIFSEFTSVQDIAPLLNVIPELPPDLQQQLIRLPVDLVGKFVSRVAARTIRRALL
ncbi:putative ABC-type Cd(2+) transporter [Helianthus annuus]|nr:putative ABC-type Cd(2+) transporter [Helianthus annuus]